jgi:GT2 family glycosyltransferase
MIPTSEAEQSTLRPSVSVVIPTSRADANLIACLSTLFEQDDPPLEVIVVDNASPVSLGSLPQRFAGLRVIRNDINRGFAVACNQGIAESRGDFVLLLNDDTELEPGTLRELVETLVSRPAWGACQAKLLLMDDPAKLDTAGSFLTASGFLVHRGAYEAECQFTVSDEVFTAKGAALLVRRRALDDVGPFDPDFFAYFEESDLCWRLWLAGWEVGFAADARVHHRVGTTASMLPSSFVQFHSYKNRICSLLKNVGPTRLAWTLPLHLSLCLGLAAWFCVRGRPELGGAIVRAIGWNVRQLPRTLVKRKRVQQRRRVSDRQLMPRITRRTPLRTLFAYAKGAARAW